MNVVQIGVNRGNEVQYNVTDYTSLAVKQQSKNAVVTFAKGSHYEAIVQNLKATIPNHFNGDFYIFKKEENIGCPNHIESPYAFKPHAIKKLFNKGYKNVLWLDSAITTTQSLTPLFEYIEQNESYFYIDGWNCAQFTNDSMLEYFKLTRDEAESIPQIYACVIGLSNTTKGNMFLTQWMDSIPYFRGSWTNDGECTDKRYKGHRHDQSAASIIAHKLNILKTREETNKYVQVVCGCNEVTVDTCLRTK
jgi:hypothetical protein